MLNTTKVNLTTSEYNIINLDIPEAKSIVKIKVREGKLIKAANTLYIIN
jgi:hypothetical protein